MGAAANKYSRPKTVLHVVTLYYRDGTTEEQKQAVLDGVEKMAAEIPGIRNVWLRPLKVQGTRAERQPDGSYRMRAMTDAFVIEFESETAFKAYEDHPAHRAWADNVYLPVRGYSYTHDITN
ncbi:MAG: Dabb family protein [Bryobacteraceae bacterium]